MKPKGKVAFCVPFLERPTEPFIAALEAAIPVVTAAGWDECLVQEVGCPYVSHARATMLRKALDAKADVIVFLDYDLSFRPTDLLKLVETEGDFVAGLYRYKKPEVQFMGAIETDDAGLAITRPDGCIKGYRVPAGFLKITKEAVHHFMTAYPELIYGPKFHPSVDLFNHGAFEGVWFGEDMAVSRRWLAMGREIWVVPDLSLTHHSATEAFPGNFHEYLASQPGGALSPAAA